MTLLAAFREFVRHPSARLLLALSAGSSLVRVGLGRWTAWDALIPLIILALEPFTEWVIHVVLLHWKPRQVGGRSIDPLIARKHRAHHRDPKDAELVFVPMQVLVTAVTVGAVLYLVLLPTLRLGVTAMAAAYTMFLVYEWVHFLIHSTYRPKTRLYRYVWRAHRLHHYRNERYWFGVTLHMADHLLGTFPEKDEVPASDTARTLGVAETVR
ncbi:MAG: hypothetical protein QOG87_3631 [Actinomycetota bacterium]|jgi:hypothetical protein